MESALGTSRWKNYEEKEGQRTLFILLRSSDNPERVVVVAMQ